MSPEELARLCSPLNMANVEESIVAAKDRYGALAVNAAYGCVFASGDKAAAEAIMRADDPGEELMRRFGA